MNVLKVFAVTLLIITTSIASAQDKVIGTWKTIDENTGEPKSMVEIYQKGNKLYGKISRILNESKRNRVCDECEGADHNKPIEGMVIIKGMKKDGDEYSEGTIMDPENGKVYRCKIWMDEDNPNTINVRGYIAFFYRTQQWIRS